MGEERRLAEELKRGQAQAQQAHANAIQGAGYGLLQLGMHLYSSFAGALALDNGLLRLVRRRG